MTNQSRPLPICDPYQQGLGLHLASSLLQGLFSSIKRRLFSGWRNPALQSLEADPLRSI